MLEIGRLGQDEFVEAIQSDVREKKRIMKTRKLFHFMWSGLVVAGLTFVPTQADAQGQPFGGPVVGQDTVRPNQDRMPARPFNQPTDQPEKAGQSVMINSRYAGWEGATEAGDKRISDQLRANWIMVDANGRFSGSIQPTQNASFKNMNVFLMHMGRLVKQTSVDENGRFAFNNVRQGAYALIGWGENGFFAFGVNIVAFNPNSPTPMMSNMRVTAFQNKTTINTDWIQFYAARVNYRVYGRYPTGEGRGEPQNLYGLEGLYTNAPAGNPATSISSHTVRKTADGRFVGRVHQMNSLNGRPVDVRTTKVLLLENDSVVAATSTDNYGVFEFEGVPDGTYGLLAAGVDGVGLIGLNVGSGSATMNEMGELVNDAGQADVVDFTLVSSETMGWLNHYAGEVAYRRGLLAPRPQTIANSQQFQGYGMCPSCNNQMGGCSTCQGAYQNSMCKSRGLTFEQWQAMGCQCSGGFKSYFGDGKFISSSANELRKGFNKIDDLFEKAFYNNSSYNFNGGTNYNYNPSCPSCGTPGCTTCGY